MPEWCQLPREEDRVSPIAVRPVLMRARPFGEEAKCEDAVRSVDLFVRYRAAHCRRVHANLFGDILIIIGWIAFTPFSRKSGCHRMIDSHIHKIIGQLFSRC
jgi:hypothetical protein